jgi:dihydroorotase
LNLIIAKLTSGPAKIIGDKYGKLGTMEVGSSADVTLFDPDLAWKVDSREFASKGKNTPLNGKVLKGKVMATIFGGEVVYQDKTVNDTRIRDH